MAGKATFSTCISWTGDINQSQISWGTATFGCGVTSVQHLRFLNWYLMSNFHIQEKNRKKKKNQSENSTKVAI